MKCILSKINAFTIVICIFFFHSSNAIDTKFDEAVGHIEDIIMGRYIPLTGVLNNFILEMFNAFKS